MVHATYPDNYTYAAVHDQLQTFRRKEKKLKGSLAILKSFRLLTGQRKTGTEYPASPLFVIIYVKLTGPWLKKVFFFSNQQEI